MPFKKGHAKLGGRKSGVQNVVTVLKKQRIAEFEARLEENGMDPIKELSGLMKYLKKNEQAQVWIALLPYRYPKLKNIEITQENPFTGMSKDELLNFAQGLVKFLKTEESK